MKLTKIAVIGAAGAMGKWFSDFFLKNGKKIIASDKDKRRLFYLAKKFKIETAKNNIEAVKKANLVLISVPPENFEEVIKEIAPHIKENQTVIDITSLKEKPVKIMKKYIKKGKILGSHPLFGPGAKEIGQNFVLTPTSAEERISAKKFGNWLKKKGRFNVITMSPKEHDELMSIVLGLTHFIGLLAGDTLLNFNPRKLAKVSGTSFKILLNLVENVVRSNPELYAEIQFNLPTTNRVESLFEEKLKEWRMIIRNKNKKEFIRKMKNLRKIYAL